MEPTVQRFRAGDVIVKADTDGDDLYLIRSGRVRVVKKTSRKVVELATLGKNEFFGEMALLTRQRRSASVVAVEDGELVVIPHTLLTQTLEHTPGWLQTLIQGMALRLHRMNERIGRDLLHFQTGPIRKPTR